MNSTIKEKIWNIKWIYAIYSNILALILLLLFNEQDEKYDRSLVFYSTSFPTIFNYIKGKVKLNNHPLVLKSYASSKKLFQFIKFSLWCKH